MAIDTMGNFLGIRVHAANIHGTNSGSTVLAKTEKKYQPIDNCYGNAGYRNTFEKEAAKMVKVVDIVQRNQKSWTCFA